MHCPNDGATLQMTSREGIEIDYCPECRGVWLDRGELDKLIERGSQPVTQAHRRDDDDEQRYQERRHNDERRHESHHYDNDHHKKHKKESFLGDMFDF